MLHEILISLVSPIAEGEPAPATTLQISIVTGIVAIAVSLIGVWGTRTTLVKKGKTKPATIEDRLEAEIERLERICYEWNIDPRNGLSMQHKRHEEGGRHAQASTE